MIFISEGEWSVLSRNYYSQVSNLLKIGPGSWINEEGVFYDRVNPYTVTAISDHVEAFSIKESDVFHVFTKPIIKRIKTNFEAKDATRSKLVRR